MDEEVNTELNNSLNQECKKYGGKFRKYDYSQDADYCLDTTPHELLDRVPRKSIKEQVEMFIDAGVRLDESRRNAMLSGAFVGDDTDIPEDLDELETILDKPDIDVQDYDTAIDYLNQRKREIEQTRKAAEKQERKVAENIDTNNQNVDNSSDGKKA